jgi:hypothetical protein
LRHDIEFLKYYRDIYSSNFLISKINYEWAQKLLV